MSGREKARPGGQWYGTTAPGPRQVCGIDQRVSELINIDGGTWNPTKPIVFGGAGLKLNGVGGLNGGVTTKQGYGTSDPRIELPASVWPSFSMPSTRTRSLMLSPATFGASAGLTSCFSAAGFPSETGFGQSLNGAIYPNQIRLHDGATIDKATFYYRITGTKPGALPGTPELVICARYTSAPAAESMCTTGVRSGISYFNAFSSGTRDGLTLDSWYNNGETIAFEYVPDQNNVIDVSTYMYMFGILIGETTEFYGVKLDLTIPDRRYE